MISYTFPVYSCSIWENNATWLYVYQQGKLDIKIE